MNHGCTVIVAAMSAATTPGASGPGGDHPPAARPLRQDAQRTVARVVAVATRVLADAPEATMQEIADAAGLGRATVYRHFATREDLMAAITVAAFSELGVTLEQSRLDEGDVVDALHRALEAILAVGDRYRFLAERPHAVDSPEKRAAVQERFAPVLALIARGRDEGVIDPGVTVEWAGAVLGGVLRAALEQVARGELDRAEAPALMVRTLLGGVGAAPSAGRGAPS